jgi:hypothetical protein
MLICDSIISIESEDGAQSGFAGTTPFKGEK